MNKKNVPICCVICLNDNGDVLLEKRGKEPYKEVWALISGKGYAKKQLTLEQGVYDEVLWDVSATPSEIEYLFTASTGQSEVVVYKAKVDPKSVFPREQDVLDIQWCPLNEISKFGELAYKHSEILRKFSAHQSNQQF